MTNKEAIERLQDINDRFEIEDMWQTLTDRRDYEALDLAIKALENMESMTVENMHDIILTKHKKGKWKRELKPYGGFGDSVMVNTCSNCRESFVYHGNDPYFCPNCGADMRGDEE